MCFFQVPYWRLDTISLLTIILGTYIPDIPSDNLYNLAMEKLPI